MVRARTKPLTNEGEFGWQSGSRGFRQLGRIAPRCALPLRTEGLEAQHERGHEEEVRDQRGDQRTREEQS